MVRGAGISPPMPRLSPASISCRSYTLVQMKTAVENCIGGEQRMTPYGGRWWEQSATCVCLRSRVSNRDIACLRSPPGVAICLASYNPSILPESSSTSRIHVVAGPWGCLHPILGIRFHDAPSVSCQPWYFGKYITILSNIAAWIR